MFPCTLSGRGLSGTLRHVNRRASGKLEKIYTLNGEPILSLSRTNEYPKNTCPRHAYASDRAIQVPIDNA
jgi:hypothetical protein